MQPAEVSLNLKARIQRHYDLAAPFYRELWGIHIHHGYWEEGTENKEVAQEQLIQQLAKAAEIPPRARVLDVGCGFGGSAKYLAERFGSHVVGITISLNQIQMAAGVTAGVSPRPQFALMDAEHLALTGPFDIVWSIEAISHLSEKESFFHNSSRLLQRNGRFACVDWFKADGLSSRDEDRYIAPIVERMLLPELATVRQYAGMLASAGFRIVTLRDVSSHVSKTWDVCLNFAQIPAVARLAVRSGKDFVSFLRGFAAMRDGFRTGAFRCALLVAEKNGE
jgi:tocopherol O-methyltransferase